MPSGNKRHNLSQCWPRSMLPTCHMTSLGLNELKGCWDPPIWSLLKCELLSFHLWKADWSRKNYQRKERIKPFIFFSIHVICFSRKVHNGNYPHPNLTHTVNHIMSDDTLVATTRDSGELIFNFLLIFPSPIYDLSGDDLKYSYFSCIDDTGKSTLSQI